MSIHSSFLIHRVYDNLCARAHGAWVRRRAGMAGVNPFLSFETYSPTLEELFDRFTQNFTGWRVPKANPVREVNMEVVMPPETAAAGGALVPVEIPAYDACPTCGGTGRAGYSACDACAGEGLVLRARTIDVPVPPGTRDGTRIPVSLAPMGVRNLVLNVVVRCAGNAGDQGA